MTQVNPAVGDRVLVSDAAVPAKNGKAGVIVRVPVNSRPLEGTNRFKVQLEDGGEYVTRYSRDLSWPAVVPTAGGLKVGDRVTVSCPSVADKHGKLGRVASLPSATESRFMVNLDNGGTFKTSHATNLLLSGNTPAASAASAPSVAAQAAAAPTQPAQVRQAVIDSTFALGQRVKINDASVPAKNGKVGEVAETPAMREDRRYKVALEVGGTYFTSKATDLLLVAAQAAAPSTASAVDEDEYDDTFEEGDRVMVVDPTVPAKNGRRGVVIEVPADRDDRRYKVQLDNGETYWTGNPDDLKESTAPLAGSNARADKLENKTLEQDLNQGRTVMSVLKNTLDDNKANAILAARVEAGKLILLQLTSRIKPLVPMYVQGYLDHPAAGLVLANLIAFSQKQWLGDNAKAAVVADCAMKAAMLNAGAALEIPKYINDAINGALEGIDISKLG